MTAQSIYVALTNFAPACLEEMRNAGYNVTVRDNETPVGKIELKTLVRLYDAVIVGDNEPITEDVAAASSRMRVLGTLAVHLHHVDIEAMNWAGVHVVNARRLRAQIC